MRVLALSSWWPEPANNGSRLRIANLLRGLARQHEVHLVALAQEPVQDDQRKRLEQSCASVAVVPQRTGRLSRADLLASLWRPEPASVRATWNPAFARLALERASAIRPDIVVAFQLAVAPYARLIVGVPRLLEELEVTPLLEQYVTQPFGPRRLRSWLTWQKHRNYVMRLLGEFDACTVVSPSELAHVRRVAPVGMRIAVVPNGADVDGCDRPWGEIEHDTLVYPGALSFDANFDAMAYFLSSSFPAIRAARPSVRLRITGKTEPTQRAALPATVGVEFTGYISDVRPVIARSWAEVVPLRKGGGTRLKILEALALGTPVVATAKGAEGLDLEDGVHLLIADSADEFARITVRLLEQPELRARLAAAGRQAVRERYDWRVVSWRLNELVAEVAAR